MKKAFLFQSFFFLFFLPSFSLIYSTPSEDQNKKSIFNPSFTFDEKGKLEGHQDSKDLIGTTKSEDQGIKAEDQKLNLKSSSENFLGSKEKNKTWITSRHFTRMLFSLCLIVGFGSLFFILSYFWKRKFQTTVNHKKMRVITQFYLGSKKKLIILRVAGEYLLLGVTDHNISLIKTLSLLDEDSSLESEENFSDHFLKLQDKKSVALENQIKPSIKDKSFIEDKHQEKEFENKVVPPKKVASLDEIRSLLENRLRNRKKIG